MDASLNYLTSGPELQQIVNSCKACSKLIRFGKNIISYDQLPYLSLGSPRTNSSVWFLNTKLPNDPAGHWCTLIQFSSKILLCDGLDYVIKRKDVMYNIRSFCDSNNCELIIMQLRCQEDDSTKCGYLALAFLAKFHVLSRKKFFNMQPIFKRNSITTNEKLMLNFAQKHFGFQI